MVLFLWREYIRFRFGHVLVFWCWVSCLNLLSLLPLICKLGKAMCLHPRNAVNIKCDNAFRIFSIVYNRGWQSFFCKETSKTYMRPCRPSYSVLNYWTIALVERFMIFFTFKNIKIILSSWVTQKQKAGWIWPTGHSCQPMVYNKY